MHEAELVRPQGTGVLDGLDGGKVEPVDEDEDHVASRNRHMGERRCALLELGLLVAVLAVETDEHEDQRR